jgi:hypothetical protein
VTVKEAMLIPSFENTYTLLETYVGKRPRRGPFPLESAFTWSLLLNAQTCNRVRGGMLEIGVEFGTSAFLLLEALAADEHATLIDLVKTEEWLAGINGPYSNHTAHTFIVGNTLKLNHSEIPTSCRWIHVDGGHLYHHVSNDLELVAGALSAEGIMVVDDFFEIRWPDVTFATMDFLRANKKVVPFMLVNRKLYCASTPESADAYKAMVVSFLENYTAQIGQVRSWDDVSMLGESVLVVKMELAGHLQALEK